MLIVKLGRGLEAAIARIAVVAGKFESSIVREAVVRYLKDIEDAALVKKSRAASGRAKPITAVRKVLGLDCATGDGALILLRESTKSILLILNE